MGNGRQLVECVLAVRKEGVQCMASRDVPARLKKPKRAFCMHAKEGGKSRPPKVPERGHIQFWSRAMLMFLRYRSCSFPSQPLCEHQGATGPRASHRSVITRDCHLCGTRKVPALSDIAFVLSPHKSLFLFLGEGGGGFGLFPLCLAVGTPKLARAQTIPPFPKFFPIFPI